MLPTNDENLVKKSPKGYAPAGRLYAEGLVKLLVLGAPHSTPVPTGV